MYSNSYNERKRKSWIPVMVIVIIIGIIIICLASGVSMYNGLVSANQDVESKWSQVENVMQSRADKINNMVEVVKGYVKHEEKVFNDVVTARSILMNGSSDIKSKLEADSNLTTATRGILLLVENYPDLKANQQFHDLNVAIEGAENRVSTERRNFIESVQVYNTKVKRFPGNIFARMMGFEEKKYFEAAPGAQEAPKVKF